MVSTSRRFGGSILRGVRRNVRNECGRGGWTSVMFTQTIGRGDQDGQISTPVRNQPQGDSMTGRCGKVYRQTEWFSYNYYEQFSNQCLDKNQKQLILQWLKLYWYKMATRLRKHWYFWTLDLQIAWQTIWIMLKKWILC